MSASESLHVKVTVVTVVFNAVETIESTIRSVLSQDYGNLEYVVIDGGSTDGTTDVISRYRDRIAHFVSERDGGIYDAMNKGVAAATGDWIGVMNAGDVFSSADVLSRMFDAEDHHAGVDVVYGDAVAVDGNRRFADPGAESVEGLARGPVYRHGASFVRRETHLKFPFDLTLKARLGFALDFEQIHRMFAAGCVFRKVPVHVLDYARRGTSTVSPFKPGYYNYLITHDMRCSVLMRGWLMWLACWQKGLSILKRWGGIRNEKLAR